MTTRIDKIVPHSLGNADAAFGRLLGIKPSIESKSWIKADVEVLNFNGDREQHKLAVTIRISAAYRSVTHTLTFIADSANFRVTSDPADELFEPLVMAVEAGQLEAMLREALK